MFCMAWMSCVSVGFSINPPQHRWPCSVNHYVYHAGTPVSKANQLKWFTVWTVLCSELTADLNVDKECRIERANLQARVRAQGCCPTAFPQLKKGERALRPVMKLLRSAQTINWCELWVTTLGVYRVVSSNLSSCRAENPHKALIETQFLEVIAFSRILFFFFFSKTLWPVKRKWFACIMTCLMTETHSAHLMPRGDSTVTALQTEEHKFSTNLCGSAEKNHSFSFTVHELYNRQKWTWDSLDILRLLKVRCGVSNVTANRSHPLTNAKIRGWSYLYSHKCACMQNMNSRYDYRTFAGFENTLTLFLLSYGKDKRQIMH